jgi:hypothetical protein
MKEYHDPSFEKEEDWGEQFISLNKIAIVA